MRFVLDTHTWIWSLLTPDRRGRTSAPCSPKLNLSAISVWETLVLIRKGRLRVTSTSAQTWITDVLSRSPVCKVPVSFEVVIASEQLTFDHWDPADRLIAATTRVLDATLITADERLINVLPNQ